jgi:hypothetical protein
MHPALFDRAVFVDHSRYGTGAPAASLRRCLCWAPDRTGEGTGCAPLLAPTGAPFPGSFRRRRVGGYFTAMVRAHDGHLRSSLK